MVIETRKMLFILHSPPSNFLSHPNTSALTADVTPVRMFYSTRLSLDSSSCTPLTSAHGTKLLFLKFAFESPLTFQASAKRYSNFTYADPSYLPSLDVTQDLPAMTHTSAQVM